jgi:hypothetical protein
MKIFKKLLLILVAAILLGSMGGCESLEDTYKEFIGTGETIYIGRADSIKTKGGRNRIELSWLLISDPKIAAYKVYWNNRTDSIEGNLVKSDQVDTVRLLLENLPENIYQFDIFLFDKNRNSSVRSSSIGRVYGENYERTLANRTYTSYERSGLNLIIDWMEPESNMVMVEVEYQNTEGEEVVRRILPELLTDTLTQFPISGTFEYRTLYLPEPNAIDTFYSAPTTVTLVETEGIELDKSLFSNLSLEDDSDTPRYSANVIENLWDGPTSLTYFLQKDTQTPPIPNWISIDLGKKSILTKFRVNNMAHHATGWVYRSTSVRRFELWVTNEPQTNPNWRSDGSWKKLGEFEVIKPSGLPVGENSAEDIEEHLRGHLFEMPVGSGAYRYVRFVNLQTWNDSHTFSAMEFTFYGYPAE